MWMLLRMPDMAPDSGWIDSNVVWGMLTWD